MKVTIERADGRTFVIEGRDAHMFVFGMKMMIINITTCLDSIGITDDSLEEYRHQTQKEMEALKRGEPKGGGKGDET